MPFVGAEVHRLTVALRAVSTQLSVAVTALSDLQDSAVGPRAAGGAVEAGRASLADVLAGLRMVVEDAAAVTARHSVPSDALTIGSGLRTSEMGPRDAG
jgi:hypothetical protein